MQAKLGKSRIYYWQNGGTYRVVVRPALRVFAIGFLIIWIIGWGVGGGQWFGTLFKPTFHLPSLSELPKVDFFGASIWIVGIVLAIGNILQNVLKFEILDVTLEHMHHIRTLAYLPYRKSTYRISDVRDLRASSNERTDGEGGRQTVNSVAFAYGAKTRYIFSGIDIVEANDVIQQLRVNCLQLKNTFQSGQ